MAVPRLKEGAACAVLAMATVTETMIRKFLSISTPPFVEITKQQDAFTQMQTCARPPCEVRICLPQATQVVRLHLYNIWMFASAMLDQVRDLPIATGTGRARRARSGRRGKRTLCLAATGGGACARRPSLPACGCGNRRK